jgi:hypothetical protein
MFVQTLWVKGAVKEVVLNRPPQLTAISKKQARGERISLLSPRAITFHTGNSSFLLTSNEG